MTNCSQCQRELKLYEKDERRGWLIMRCDSCGLNYHYKKGSFGDKWKLVKTSQLLYMTEKAART
jgi:predicted amidophosphoribosyltransferase